MIVQTKFRILCALAFCVSAVPMYGTAPRAKAAERTVDDQQITDKIEDELALDHAVNATMVDVATRDGIVKLTGRVNNLLAKDRAARIASTVKGVRSVVNQLVIRPLIARTDEEIKRDVEAALLSDPATDAYELSVKVRDGEVELSGTVDSYPERRLAGTVAMGVRGVTGFSDRMMVHYATKRPDAEIRQDILQGLKWNTYVDGGKIGVEVAGGKVKLNGIVGSAAEKNQATTVAYVAGVDSVDASGLRVEPWAKDEDLRAGKYTFRMQTEIAQAVRDALIDDPRVKSFNVDVQVSGSTVTLRGEVDNLKAKRAAEQDARNTTGVTFVINRIKVKQESPPSDADIKKNIASAFVRDPFLERFETTITVLDGTAYLYGIVDSYFEKRHAEDVASRINGVVDVQNHLNVDRYNWYAFDPYVDLYGMDLSDAMTYERRAPGKSDREIKQAIEDELWWSPFVDANEVSVSVDRGIATLTGTVNSWSERAAATENAYEGGATLVDNDLGIDSSDN